MELKTLFSDIADAIREKTGTTDKIVASDFPSKIRSITTGGGSGEIPNYKWVNLNMTSNTTPAPYVADSSTTYIDSDKNTYEAYKAFDGLLLGGRGTCFYSAENKRWLQIYFGKGVKCSIIRFYPAESYVPFFPKQIAIFGSNDGKNWIKIADSGSVATAPEKGEWREVYISIPFAYHYYKFEFSDAYNGTAQTILSEVEFYADGL